MRIMQNIVAMNALRSLRRNDDSLNRSLSRLSSGLRIRTASDDAAGLTLSESLKVQVRGAQQGIRNVEDGLGLINTADGALNEVNDILLRMQEIATQAANGNYQNSDRQASQIEFNALMSEITTLSTRTDFNTINLFTGQAGGFTTGNFNTSVGGLTTAGSTVLNLTGPASGASALNSITITGSDNGTPFIPAVTSGPPLFTVITPAVPATPPSTITLTQGVDYTVTPVSAGIAGTTQLFTYSITLNNASLAALPNNPPFSISAVANMTYPTVVNPLPIDIQYGANIGEMETINVPQMNTSVIGVASLNVSTQTAAQAAIAGIASAITSVSAMRTTLGASYNKLEHVRANQATMTQNQLTAYSQIRDADVAAEATSMTRGQILSQSSMESLKIANDRSYITQLLNS